MQQKVEHLTIVRSAHNVRLFMCFVFVWEQTATFATYVINWLVFITEMKSVYIAVRTGPLNEAAMEEKLVVEQGLVIIKDSRLHSFWHTTLGRKPLDKWLTRRK
jgi:hypothetical protein